MLSASAGIGIGRRLMCLCRCILPCAGAVPVNHLRTHAGPKKSCLAVVCLQANINDRSLLGRDAEAGQMLRPCLPASVDCQVGITTWGGSFPKQCWSQTESESIAHGESQRNLRRGAGCGKPF